MEITISVEEYKELVRAEIMFEILLRMVTEDDESFLQMATEDNEK